ncbi:GlxA family transcriptional regulator [Paraburkholderia sp.]|uniref:GlxA family transcriptional regulator n=1 Tax=Paraburkholderia sp. TaxID=1926495 RepID=UPI0039E3C3EB
MKSEAEPQKGAAIFNRPGTTTHVDIVLFNGFALPKIAAIIEIFQRANAMAVSQTGGAPPYDVNLLSAAGGRIASTSYVFVWTDAVESYKTFGDRHLVFIAGGTGAEHAARDERLATWMRRAHESSELVHPISEGRLVLKAVGLPGRHRLDTGAAGASRYAEPPTEIQTSLRIVEDDLGEAFACQIAQAIAPHCTLFGSPLTNDIAPQVSERIMASARWIEANVDRPISIDDAAAVATMSERNFLRRFKNEIGMTPSDYLMRARLALSCRMLRESRLPVDKIARHCGIGSGGQLSKLFKKHLSTTPSDYRRRQATLQAAHS